MVREGQPNPLEENLGLSNNETERNNREIMDLRFNQSEGSKLAERITGLRPDDPRILDRLVEDQKIIRAKYGLVAKFDTLEEYERFLRDLAKKMKVDIRSQSECGKVYEELSKTGGVYFSDVGLGGGVAGVNINKENLRSYNKSLGVLEHELIHAMQNDRYPDMPIEIREYEAWFANIDAEKIRRDPEHLEPVFASYVGGSVSRWYQAINEDRDEKSELEMKPDWKDPEFFLKNIDHISDEEIAQYKKSNNYKKSIFYKRQHWQRLEQTPFEDSIEDEVV